jgi:5-methylcytosine-specific restriction endonuclease McrA
MPAKRRNTAPIAVAKLSGYVRYKIGYSEQANVSIYELACKALEKDGYKKPEGTNNKTWVTRNMHVIHEFHNQYAYWKKPKIDRPKGGPVVQPKSYVVKKVAKPSVSSDEFLKSFEWRRLRMQALLKYGSKCMCCGATPDKGFVMNVDHIKPRKLFPALALEISNLQILCEACNHGKGNWDMTDWRQTKQDERHQRSVNRIVEIDGRIPDSSEVF